MKTRKFDQIHWTILIQLEKADHERRADDEYENDKAAQQRNTKGDPDLNSPQGYIAKSSDKIVPKLFLEDLKISITAVNHKKNTI